MLINNNRNIIMVNCEETVAESTETPIKWFNTIDMSRKSTKKLFGSMAIKKRKIITKKMVILMSLPNM